MAVIIQISTPCVTVEEFHRLTGMAIGTIRDKVQNGELPRLPTSLQPGKREVILINMLKLTEMADSVNFLHPLLPSQQ